MVGKLWSQLTGLSGGGGCINKALNKLTLDVASERWAANPGCRRGCFFSGGIELLAPYCKSLFIR